MRLVLSLFIFALIFACNRNGGAPVETNLPRAEPDTASSEPIDSDAVFEKVAIKFDLPKPEAFPVKDSDLYNGPPMSVVLKGKRAKEYRTVITESARRGPNFAGRYTVITWGAGMGNFSLAIADAKTGRLIFPPFETVSRAGYDLQIDENEPAMPAFRKESTLFAFMGCPGKEYQGCSDWDKDGFYVYKFENEQFRLLKFIQRDEFNAAARDH